MTQTQRKDVCELQVADVIFRDDLYPRIDTDARVVQQYAEDLSVLPPIEVNQHNELIDGWHRWTAHKKKQAPTIPIVVIQTKSDGHLLELAAEANAKHGMQLSQRDKEGVGRRIYQATPGREREGKKARLAAILSVSPRTVRGWLEDIDKAEKEARNRRIFEMWLACHTQQEIAEVVGITQQAVDQVLQETAKLPELVKSDQSAAEHALGEKDFKPPIYNIWSFAKKSSDLTHFGNTEVGIVDRLLYLYTQPFDTVVDTFAGSGSTGGICKKRFRRYWVSDRKVEPELVGKVREWDVTEGLPPLARWKDVRLVYLDPPYWKQAEGKYSKDATDFANMPLDEFTAQLSGLVKAFAKKLTAGSHIALIIQPTQWNAPERQFTDHVGDLLRLIKLPVDMRYSCPYQTEQYNAQMVEWAKENKKCLVLTRELIVWTV